MLKFETQAPEFSGFGPSILIQQTRRRLARHGLPADRMEARAMLHDHCPLEPGVYGWLDRNRQICYVGKSKSLRKRLLSYFAKTPADPKAGRIRDHSQQLVWEPMSCELLALIREQELIYRWRPDFNTQGQPTRRQPAFISFADGPAPNTKMVRQMSPRVARAFGPIAGTAQLRAAVESVNQIFHLRDCPDKTHFSFNNQRSLFDNPVSAKCIRFELGSCPAPCAGRCSQGEYQSNYQRALKFLSGQTPEVLDRLRHQMAHAAVERSYERAIVLRNHLDNLTWLSRRLADLRNSQKLLNGVLQVKATRNRTAWLVLRGGQLIGSAMEPTSATRAARAHSYLQKVSVAEARLPVNILEMNLQMIVTSWFRRNTCVNSRLISFEDAIERCERGFLHECKRKTA